MKTTKTIKITGQEILEMFVSISEDCTIAEAKDILKNADVVINMTETGMRTLKEIEISYETHQKTIK